MIQSKNVLGAFVSLGFVLSGFLSSACAGPREMKMDMPMNGSDKPMTEELVELRAKVARLEAALEQNHRGTSQEQVQKGKEMHSRHGSSSNEKRMGMKMKGMKGSSKPMMMGGGSGMMGMDMMKMMGMMHGKGMGMMKMGQDAVPKSALPGFPSISHIYHIGATGFFLDHAKHLGLTNDQEEKLGKIKKRSLKKQKEAQEDIEKLEQEIWELTGSDSPRIEKITDKIEKVGGLHTKKRVGFIRAVGEAATVLDMKQREKLIGEKKEADEQDSHSH